MMPSRARTFVLGAACTLSAVAIWAGWLVAMRLGVTTRLAATDLTALRFAVAGLILLPVVVKRGLAIDRLGWSGLVAVVLGVGAPCTLLVGAGLSFAPVTHASALFQGMVPLAVAVLAVIVLKEAVPPVRRVGLGLIVLGALAIGGPGLWNLGDRQDVGHVLFLATAALWAWYTVAIRRAAIDGLHAAAIAAVASLLVYLSLYVLFIEHRLFDVPTGTLIWQAFYQGVLTATVSLALYGRGVQLLGASTASAFVALGPPLAALMAIPALGEWPSPIEWMAVGLTTAGVYVAGGGPLPAVSRVQ